MIILGNVHRYNAKTAIYMCKRYAYTYHKNAKLFLSITETINFKLLKKLQRATRVFIDR